MKAVKNPLFET